VISPFFFFIFFGSFFPLLEDVDRKLRVELQIEVKPQGQQNGKKEHLLLLGENPKEDK
jgi:hypothetical protein